MEEKGKAHKGHESLHVAMFPWLAMGHLIPFFHLSKHLAQKGHKISFISTPRNLQRLPKIPQILSPLINLISVPFPHVPNLTPHAESSTGVSYSKQQLLRIAVDELQPTITSFLESSKLDWIICDFASHWLPSTAAELGVRCCFFGLFNAALHCLVGPPAVLVGGSDPRKTLEDYVRVPEWIPFESNVAFRSYEITRFLQLSSGYSSVMPDTVRMGTTIRDSEVVAVRSCIEFEPEWFDLLRELYQKPLVPVGFLPPFMEDDEDVSDVKWVGIKEWFDEQRFNSVVYVALGTEALLSQEEVNELALGLEKSGLSFFWVLSDPPESTQKAIDMLPNGFLQRVEGRGKVCTEWAPQVKILSHDSVGGFLTHCGWNTIIEGLALGRVLILLSMINDQGANATLLLEKGLGIEVARKEDGLFTSDAVAESRRIAMVDDPGSSLRASNKEAKKLFGDRETNQRCIDEFIQYLVEQKEKKKNSLRHH
ncbi:LOW QUALITY PROTEIN: UDP-glycosyltransferase 91C1-like [Rhodamnia argentea]|uniref:LOW QUALITY PROTEIN: UDP-glycosyltransferase 91C1-like n=1 Tax=Rhodamnia argentea TaxID=178133 RepID=A0A8B8Q6P8_9MYRT|nr:LOW QUALITY PROTEIN: UDP-glycosyltransferase 91C1-like [Rhodamnia argentea]